MTDRFMEWPAALFDLVRWPGRSMPRGAAERAAPQECFRSFQHVSEDPGPNRSTPRTNWVCLKMGYTPNYSHLVGIMISKTIGCRGTLFSDKPNWRFASLAFALVLVGRGVHCGWGVHPIN